MAAVISDFVAKSFVAAVIAVCTFAAVTAGFAVM